MVVLGLRIADISILGFGSVLIAAIIIISLFFSEFMVFSVVPFHIGDNALFLKNREIMDFLVIPWSSISGFSYPEISHLYDVKKLFIGLEFLMTFLSILLFLFVKLSRGLVRYSLSGASYILVLFLAAVSSSLLSGFNNFWIGFHRLFFPQGNWSFSVDSLIITLYPSSFFFSFVIIFLLLILSCAIVIIGISLRSERVN